MVFEYFTLALILGLLLYLFIKSAKQFHLVDSINERSSHKFPTIRGGGFVMPLSALIYAGYYRNLNGFFIGLLLIACVSIWDDIKSLPNSWRLLIQLISVLFLFYETLTFSIPILITVVAIIVILGTINAVNFMDGINGISVFFGFVTIITFIILNSFMLFASNNLLLYILCGILVFGLFNFRKRALCFAGDVGSVSLGYILLYFSLLFFLHTGNYSVIVLWTVYGVDSILTIIHRLYKKENILKPHRSHLYQYYANELGVAHLKVATVYGLTQLAINALFIANTITFTLSPAIFTLFILLFSGLTYIFIRIRVLSKIEVVDISYSKDRFL